MTVTLHRPSHLAICICLLWSLFTPEVSLGHGGNPQITGFVFPMPGEVWALTDNQGIFAHRPDGVHWLCEDAIVPGAGIGDVAVVDAAEGRWLLRTVAGLFVTDDGGCRFTVSPAPLDDHIVSALSQDPTRPDRVLAATATFDRQNGVYLSEDGGRTWRVTRLQRRGRFLQLMRSGANPDQVYARHDSGLFTSEDGGESWRELAVVVSGLPIESAGIRLLSAPSGSPGVLWLAHERAPETVLLTTTDHGRTWRDALRVADLAVGLVFDRQGRRGWVHSVFGGAHRTDDGGLSWTAEPVGVSRLTFVGRAPATDRLWATSSRYGGGPWALARSDDFGQTWQPVLRDFEDVDVRWRCPRDSAAVACCAALCPGRPPQALCPDQILDAGAQCDLPGPPLGADASLDARVGDEGGRDGGQPPVADRGALDSMLDATVSESDGAGSSDSDFSDVGAPPPPRDAVTPIRDAERAVFTDAIVETNTAVVPAQAEEGCNGVGAGTSGAPLSIVLLIWLGTRFGRRRMRRHHAELEEHMPMSSRCTTRGIGFDHESESQ